MRSKGGALADLLLGAEVGANEAHPPLRRLSLARESAFWILVSVPYWSAGVGLGLRRHLTSSWCVALNPKSWWQKRHRKRSPRSISLAISACPCAPLCASLRCFASAICFCCCVKVELLLSLRRSTKSCSLQMGHSMDGGGSTVSPAVPGGSP